MLTNIFADLHIHIGRDYKGNHVKISASHQLTLENILIEASRYKGIELIGVIDCHAPNVIYELKQLLDGGKAKELAEGGIRFEEVTLLLGSELEIFDDASQGPFHLLVFMPTLKAMEDFSAWLQDKMTNIHLSSQRIYCSAKALQEKTKQLGGLFIPAHVFTPFKSLYGSGVKESLTEVLNPEQIDAIELGLSSDTTMADQIAELHRYPFLTNSDSHSLQKIGREYQQIAVEEPSFTEFSRCLLGIDGRKIIKNFGMNPHLGKYYRTVCQHCYQAVELGTKQCPACHSNRIIAGVKDRIAQLHSEVKMEEVRPAYIYQVPLEYIPGLGPKTLDKLLAAFHTEMNIVHRVSFEQLNEIVADKIAQSIINMREGSLTIASGGGGKYGRVIK